MDFSAQELSRKCVTTSQNPTSTCLLNWAITWVLVLAFVALGSRVVAQSPLMNSANDLTQTPIPGSGHEYQQLLGETVNYSNGSVNFKITFPTPVSRGFTIPYSWSYNSAGVNTLDSVDGYAPYWNLGQNYNWPKKDGWNLADGTPWATISFFSQTPPTGPPGMTLTPCNYVSGITFTDISGVTHNLATGASAPTATGSNDFYQCPSSPYVIPPVGDGQAIGILWPGTGTNLISGSGIGSFLVTDKNGMTYSFNLSVGGSQPLGSGPATSVEDRNGNYVNLSSNKDTAGRSGPTVTGSPATSVTTEGEAYSATWSTVSVGYTISKSGGGASGIGCGTFPTSVTGGKNVLSSLTLPNGKEYQFFYNNSYGLLSEVIFPDGGWIKYTYQLPSGTGDQIYNEQLSIGGFDGNHNSVSYGCVWQYQTPVLASRTVSFDGSNVAQTQTFAYATNWQYSSGLPNGWMSKTTTVNNTDNVRNLTSKVVYAYQPGTSGAAFPFQSSKNAAQIPQENTITYYDWGSSTKTKMVTKSWYDNFNLASETTTLYTNGGGTLTSGSVYTYNGNPCASVSTAFTYLLEQDDYDFTSSSTPVKKTIYNYKCFSPANPSSYSQYSPSNAPSNWPSSYEGVVVPPRLYSVAVEDGSNNVISATQYNYDESGLASVSPTQYDSAYNSVTARGNLTSALRCNPAPTTLSNSPICTAGAKTSYTFDISGQPASMTDPKTNTTQFSFADEFSDTSSAPTTNAYLTNIRYPPVNGVVLQKNFKYSYELGYLTQAIDENSNSTSYTYNDPLSRLTETDYADGGRTTISYNDSSASVTTSKLLNSNLSETSVAYRDGMMHTKRTQLTSDPDGTTIVDISYDGEGKLYTQSNPYRSSGEATAGTTTYYYDALGRPIKTAKPDGNSVQICYDGVTSTPAVSYCSSSQIAGSVGTRADTTDEKGNHWQRVTDALGRLRTVLEPNGSTNAPSMETDYSYDPIDNLTAVTQKGQGGDGPRARSFSYDSLSRLHSGTNPETGPISYTYDANSNLYTKTDARGIQVTYLYDALNRLLSKTYSDGSTPSACYTSAHN